MVPPYRAFSGKQTEAEATVREARTGVPAVKKLEYEAPAVSELGRVEEMTQGGASFEV